MDIVRKYRSARIEVVANGFVVEIGCQRVVAETPEKLKKLISDYLDDPINSERRLLNDSIQYGSCVAEQENRPNMTIGLQQPAGSGAASR